MALRYRMIGNWKLPLRNSLLILGGVGLCLILQVLDAKSLDEVGYVEKLWLESYDTSVSAKVDTGALTSSLNAPNYEIFKKNGKKWVRFTLRTKDGDRYNIKKPIERFVRIRRAGVDVKRRPIINLKVCLGGKTRVAEFSLTDRSSMNYPVIVGRAFLNGRFVVNPAEAFLASKKCD